MVNRIEAVHCAVIPAAGRGTRFLPETKAVPKEMLPVMGRPAIEHVAEEAGKAGITDMLMITRNGKESIEKHFEADPELEAVLEKSGKTRELEQVRAYLSYPKVHSVQQGDPLGLGHAVLQAKKHVGEHPFAVLLPDDIMHPNSHLLKNMLDVRKALGGSVIGLLRVTPEQATSYGNAAVTALPIPEGVHLEEGKLFRLDKVVEKPPINEVLSEYAIAGRYVFDPAIFSLLENLSPGRGGEYQLTDAFAQLIDMPPEDGGGVYGVAIDDRRFDTGDPLGYLAVNVSLALEDPAMSDSVRAMLREELEAHRK